MSAIVKAIIGAGQVLVFGSRASHGFAVYLRWQTIQVVPRVASRARFFLRVAKDN